MLLKILPNRIADLFGTFVPDRGAPLLSRDPKDPVKDNAKDPKVPKASLDRVIKALPYLLFAALIWYAFTAFFDPSVLNTGNVGWIAEGDLRQHYLGWVAIRQATELGSPLGSSPLLAYPMGAPISSTDSNPLVSLLLWPISGWLPTDFQFIGPWYLLSLTLSLVFGWKLMTHAGFDRITALLLGAVLAFQPVLFWRYGHDTLTAQWLILACLYVCVAVPEARRAVAWHSGLLLLAMTIHPYLFIMLNFITGFDLLARVLRQNGLRFGTLERVLLAFVAIQIAAMAVGIKLGVFALTTPVPNPIGVHSTDLLGMLNPYNASRVMPQLPSGEGQYEGFAYLGLGGIVLLLAVGFLAIKERTATLDWRALLPLFAAAFVAFLFALSPIVTLLGDVVFAMQLADDSPVRAVFAKLRSSGRFVWITIYVLILTALWCLPRNKAAHVRGLAVVVLALQFWDLAPLQERSRADTAWREVATSEFDTPEWQERIARAKYIYMDRALGLDFSLEVGASAFPLNTPLLWFYTAQMLALPEQLAAEQELRVKVRGGVTEPAGLYLLDRATELAFAHQNAAGILTTHDFDRFAAIETDALTGKVALTQDSHGLTELLQWCEADCTALVVAKADAAPYLSAQVKRYLGGKGSQIADLKARGSYALVLRNGQIIDEVMDDTQDVSLNALIGTRPVSLLSSVEDTRKDASIALDGVEFARKTNGLNILLVKDDGRLVTAGFDTSAQSDSLTPEADLAPEQIADAQILADQMAQDAATRLEPVSEEQIAAIAGPVSDATPFINKGRYLSKDSSLLDVLTQCRQGCAMALAVKDEASASLPLAVRVLSRQMGLTLSELDFRDGYAAIIENGIVLAQGRSHNDVVTIAETSWDRDIRVRSAGFDAGNLSSIQIDGTEMSLDHRGINLVVMQQDEGAISYHFDTHGGY